MGRDDGCRQIVLVALATTAPSIRSGDGPDGANFSIDGRCPAAAWQATGCGCSPGIWLTRATF